MEQVARAGRDCCANEQQTAQTISQKSLHMATQAAAAFGANVGGTSDRHRGRSHPPGRGTREAAAGAPPIQPTRPEKGREGGEGRKRR